MKIAIVVLTWSFAAFASLNDNIYPSIPEEGALADSTTSSFLRDPVRIYIELTDYFKEFQKTSPKNPMEFPVPIFKEQVETMLWNVEHVASSAKLRNYNEELEQILRVKEKLMFIKGNGIPYATLIATTIPYSYVTSLGESFRAEWERNCDGCSREEVQELLSDIKKHRAQLVSDLKQILDANGHLLDSIHRYLKPFQSWSAHTNTVLRTFLLPTTVRLDSHQKWQTVGVPIYPISIHHRITQKDGQILLPSMQLVEDLRGALESFAVDIRRYVRDRGPIKGSPSSLDYTEKRLPEVSIEEIIEVRRTIEQPRRRFTYDTPTMDKVDRIINSCRRFLGLSAI